MLNVSKKYINPKWRFREPKLTHPGYAERPSDKKFSLVVTVSVKP
jgi:hypothetical protein